VSEAADVTAVATEVTAEVTGLDALPEAEPLPEATEVTAALAEVSGLPEPELEVEVVAGVGVSKVDACACREKISKITMIPAATSAVCIARRAM
jgi:hypothetical protein